MAGGGETLEIINKGNSLVVMLSGEIDHHSLKTLRGTIDAQIEQHTPRLVILDFGSVNFMDSSGIGLILGRRRIAESYGGKIAVKNASGYTEKLIKLAGLGFMLMKPEVIK
jgi:stage II sporulation protein AA (anti-sigma F factor antagonist)